MAYDPSLHPPPDPATTIKVRSTWPIVPPTIDREPIRTERLMLRPFDITDVEALHELRTQREVMQWTAAGNIDESIDQTRAFVERYLPPRDTETFNCVIVYVEGDNEVVIGCGGCHKYRSELGWPEVGYMLRKEYWGKGLASEFMRGFCEAWLALPREEIELYVDKKSVREPRDDDEIMEVPEILTAMIESLNTRSSRVLEKAGFTEFKNWVEPDEREGFGGVDLALAKFKLEIPRDRIDVL